MRTFLGKIFAYLGYIFWFIFGIWGFILCAIVVINNTGFWGLVISILIFPITFLAAPWYAGLKFGIWDPMLICYGGGIISSMILWIASIMDPDTIL